ncbi:MAG: hypothetical protein Ta2B_07030 [Termitinemataceae bacterium]|nr:MAG: hypothetical protein Ta2B_07030 [Termitinemataceae bacterium]
MSVIVYSDSSGSFCEITPATFDLNYSPHWCEYIRYKGTPLYSQTYSLLRAMVSRVKGTSKGFITSDIEIKKILDVLGSPFTTTYSTYGLSVSCAELLGMQLFEICVYDSDVWWYSVPKPILRGHSLPHSHYQIKR